MVDRRAARHDGHSTSGDEPRAGSSRETKMPRTLAQHLTVSLPLVGVALLLASMLLPIQFAAVAWALAMIVFLAALACALYAQWQRRTD